MWIADMDFSTPPFIIKALRERLNHEILGYSYRPDSYFDAIINWVSALHGWDIRQEWIEFSPGVVPALNICTLAYTSPGDEIIIQPPVYPPFYGAVTDHGRRLVFNPLLENEQGYSMDFEGLRRVITPKTKMLILSNPHNPVGRVWTRDELSELAEICHEKGIIILSDEIHSDLLLPGMKHVPLASVSEKAAAITVTCMAPSKTFNLAGLQCSLAVIPDKGLRTSFKKTMEGIVPHVNALGLTAALAAYRDGAAWQAALLDYLRANRDLVEWYVARLPGLSMHHVEATYLAWIDCRSLNTSHPAALFEDAGVGLSDGTEFSAPGFVRLNFGCPRSVLTEALERMGKALERLP